MHKYGKDSRRDYRHADRTNPEHGRQGAGPAAVSRGPPTPGARRRGSRPTSNSSISTIIERRAYGSGVLQLEMRGGSGPYWYFHHRKDGKQKTVYIGKTEEPEIKLAQIKGGMGG